MFVGDLDSTWRCVMMGFQRYPVIGLALVLAFASTSYVARAGTLPDGTIDFIPSFMGTKSADIDILSAGLTLSGSNLLFSATLNATIANAANTYVLGIDRGLSTRNFSPVNLPGVTFDSVLTVTGAGTQGGMDFVSGTPISVPAGTFQISGSNITASIPLSLLPLVAGGFTSPDQFLWNFWTRGSVLGTPVAGNPGLADFVPNNSDASVVPLPTALPLFATGLGVLGLLGWRRKRKALAA
jgi:hypothetical protein